MRTGEKNAMPKDPINGQDGNPKDPKPDPKPDPIENPGKSPMQDAIPEVMRDRRIGMVGGLLLIGVVIALAVPYYARIN